MSSLSADKGKALTAAPTGTVTFLFTDIEGSTRLWEAHARAMQAAVARHDVLLRQAIETNGGYVFKTVGDAFYAAFPTAPQALFAALACQRALQSADWNATGPIQVRMALHTGVAEVRDNDYFGLPLNRVARLLSTGYGGQILISLATQQLVRDHLPQDTSLKDLGEGGLKDLVQAEHIYQVVAPDLPSQFPPLKLLDTHYIEPSGAEVKAKVHNPYKGLRAFQEADAPDFFGREELTRSLLIRMNEDIPLAHFLAVVGPSGSGKSSVVRAGVVPALRQGGIPGSERWLIVEMIPGAHPLEELEALLLNIAVNPPTSLIEQLQNDNRGLVRAVKRILPRDETVELVLLIDQFEEVFTLVEDEPTRVHFLESLHAAVTDPRSRLRVLVTLRADFFDRPLLYPDPGELMRQRTAVVLPLSAEELEKAIVNPAGQMGVASEPELIATIIKDVGEQPGALPLLQYALTEVFERRDQESNAGNMTLAAYRESGGVLGALARRADELYEGLSNEEKEACRQLFLRLITLGEGVEDTRRRVRRAELASVSTSSSASAPEDTGALDRVIDLYGRYRLLTFDRDPVGHGPTVEVAHEALIRNWGRLREWLDASRSDLRVHRQIASATAEWEGAGRDASFLASGSRLAQFQALAETSGPGKVALNGEEREYIQASIVQRDKERAAGRRRVLMAIGGLVIALAAITVFAFLAVAQAGIASDQAHAAIEQRSVAFSREVAAEAISQVKGDTMRSLLLGIEAARIAPTDESGNAIRQALLELDPPHVLYQGHEASGNMDFSPDSNRVVIAEHTGPVRILDVSSGDVKAELDHKDLVDTIQFSPDGKLIAGGSRDHFVWLWNGLTGETVYSLTGHEAPIFMVAFSPDSKLVASGSADNTARIWDVVDGKQMAQLVGHAGSVNSVQFSSDGRRVVTASDDKSARIWDAATGRQLFELDGHQSVVNTAVFSPDGNWVLTAGQDNTAKLWDANTGKMAADLTEHTDVVNNARFSHDGKLIATTSNDGTTRLWNVDAVRKATASGQTAVSTFVLQSGPSMDALFSPDDKWVVSTCNNPGGDHLWVARVFAIDTGKPVAEVGGQEQVNVAAYARPYPAARFSPDGKLLVVADGHAIGRVLKWEFYQPLDYLLTIVPNYVTRQLTCDERETYLHEVAICPTSVPTLTP